MVNGLPAAEFNIYVDLEADEEILPVRNSGGRDGRSHVTQSKSTLKTAAFRDWHLVSTIVAHEAGFLPPNITKTKIALRGLQ